MKKDDTVRDVVCWGRSVRSCVLRFPIVSPAGASFVSEAREDGI